MNLGLVGHYSVDNISRIPNRPIYGLNVGVSLVMEFVDMKLKVETLHFLELCSIFVSIGMSIYEMRRFPLREPSQIMETCFWHFLTT